MFLSENIYAYNLFFSEIKIFETDYLILFEIFHERRNRTIIITVTVGKYNKG